MLPRLLLVVLMAATVLGGCVYRDPLVHGPFLIGAERPHSGGSGCRPGDVRAQDVNSGWIEDCARTSTPLPGAAPMTPLPSAPPPPVATATIPARSAWH